jgi:hypothetical protein
MIVMSEGMKEKAPKDRIAVQLTGLTWREYLELKAEAVMAETSLGAYITKLIRGRKKSARADQRERLK